jgi:hypothetical protein
MRRLPTLRELRGTLSLLTTGATPDEEALILAIAERVREVIPPTEFEVNTDGKIVRIIGIGEAAGISCSMMPFFAWRAPLPVEQRLEIVFKSLGAKLQDLLSRAYGTPWPTAGAKPHVLISGGQVKVWWGGPAESEAIVRLAPIAWTDLELKSEG